MSKSWRDIARPVIAKVLQETRGLDEKAVRKALHNAYPFGQRSLLPYKVWLDEIKVQRNQKTFGRQPPPENPQQQSLF